MVSHDANPYWLSYIPYHIAADILAHPGANPVGREQRFSAVALFADISGFTALSEALGRAGQAGTEELTTILNGYFGPMNTLIESYSGIIATFGGDGLTVLFPYTAESRPATVRRAIQCALDMQATMPRYAHLATSAGTFGMGMQAGLALGPVVSTTAGDPAIRLLPITAGAVLDRCAEAEHQARRGEVVVHRDLLADAGAVTAGAARGDFQVLGRLRRRARRRGLPPLPRAGAAAAEATLAAYLPPAIARRLREGQAGFVNEHRPVTTLFVGFSGFDYDHDPAVGARLQRYFAAVTRIVAGYDGYVNKVDIGDKGSTYLVLFGAPVAHENDVERALRCALDLRAIPGASTRMGINSGVVYCGHAGAAARQEYTVVGAAVNLAVRLMQGAGPDQILVSGGTHRLTAGAFRWEDHVAVQVKGRADPVPVQALAGPAIRGALRLQTPAGDQPLVGRAAEMERVSARLGEVLRGQGQIVGISADAGLGKSRLTSEIARLAGARGCVAYAGSGQSYGTTTPYLVWQGLLHDFFALDPAAPLATQVAALETQLAAIDPKLVGRAPLLGVALNLPIPETDLTRLLGAELRKASLEALLVACVRARAAVTPLLLILEDCHWIDPSSQDLLAAIGRNLADVPVLLVVVYRPQEGYAGGPGAVVALPHFAELRLPELTDAEAEYLTRRQVAQLFGPQNIPDASIARITARAQGNPLYIEELINLIHDQGRNLADPEALDTVDLPSGLYSLILSRIDQLGEGEKTTLKVASVIGRLFPAAWLWGSVPQLGSALEVSDRLANLSGADLVAPARAEPEQVYVFKHILTQEVAYGSLAVATRARLHEQVGAFLETTHAGDLGRWVNVLAHHYGQSANQDKQREYFRLAGEAAQASYANDAAIAYYRRLLPLLSPAERGAVWRQVGTIWQLTGEWTQAEALYREALADSADGARTRAALQYGLGEVLSLQGAYSAALACLEEARLGWQGLGDQQAMGQAIGALGTVYWRQGNYPAALACAEQQLALAGAGGDQRGLAQATRNMSLVYWDQGDYPRALACCAQHLQVATALGDRQGVLQAVGNMGNVYGRQGDPARARACFEQTMRIATEIGDRRAVANTLGHLGGMHWSAGDYAAALASFAQQLQIAAEIGERRGIMMAVGNMGIIYTEHGAFARAATCLERQLQMAVDQDDRQYISIALANLSLLYQAQGRLAAAEPLCRQAVALGRALHIPYYLCEYLAILADLTEQQGQAAAAQPLNDEALRLAIQVVRADVELLARILAIRLRVTRGQADAAAGLAALDALAARRPAAPERAALRYAAWQIAPTPGAAQGAAAAYHALATATPKAEYRARYAALTGTVLPEPPALPPLSALVQRDPVDLPALRARIDGILG